MLTMVSSGEPEWDVCDYCGREMSEPGWLAVEVWREEPESGWRDALDLNFCRQEHAATYLSERELPPVPTSPPGLKMPPTPWWPDRLVIIALVLGLLWSLALMAVGAWTLVRHWRGQ